jgi:hypothetical protein
MSARLWIKHGTDQPPWCGDTPVTEMCFEQTHSGSLAPFPLSTTSLADEVSSNVPNLDEETRNSDNKPDKVASVAKPETILACYRKLIERKFDGSQRRTYLGRPG